MKARRTEEEMNPRPICFKGWPPLCTKPSSFLWTPFDVIRNLDEFASNDARLYYKNSWTAIAFKNGDIYFADEILLFDDILELIRARFTAFYLSAPIRRQYAD